jgi:hypothetical protein
MTTFRLVNDHISKSHKQVQFEFLILTKYYDTYFKDKNNGYAAYIVYTHFCFSYEYCC